MKTKETYKQAKMMVEKYTAMMKLYNNLISFGVPQSKVQYYETPCVSSDYSMGELVIVRCNGFDIDRKDKRQEYARSCKYHAKHGIIVLDFTKADLKKYVTLCEAKAKNVNRYFEDADKITALKEKAYNEKESVVRKFRTWG